MSSWPVNHLLPTSSFLSAFEHQVCRCYWELFIPSNMQSRSPVPGCSHNSSAVVCACQAIILGKAAAREHTSIGVEDEGCVRPLGAHTIDHALRIGQAELCKLRWRQQACPGVKQLHHLPPCSNHVSVSNRAFLTCGVESAMCRASSKQLRRQIGDRHFRAS